MPHKSLMQVLADRVGLFAAGRVMSFVTCWLIAEAEVGLAFEEAATARERVAAACAHPTLTVEQYAEYWRVSRAQAFKEQKRFREAFEPEGFSTPADLYAFISEAAPGYVEGTGLALAVWPA